MRDKVLAVIKRRLKLSDDTSQDELIMDYIEQVEWKIKSYCNISEVPEALKFVWVSMVIDILRIEHPNEQFIIDNVSESIASMKLGDTSIFYGTKGNDLTSTSKSTIDELVTNYRPELNRYRKLKTI